ncbi:hypothetical protein CEXT_771161 [Caerostris extrusa]|uniref:Uncharacterized protein n=1 Tax=Caerostris extrusa TaxID=172846 RepID=A0AAV4PNZ8_CAEEX|nr:hypothetical protein CEXT_771161 [Caerostris extrusa]
MRCYAIAATWREKGKGGIPWVKNERKFFRETQLCARLQIKERNRGKKKKKNTWNRHRIRKREFLIAQHKPIKGESRPSQHAEEEKVPAFTWLKPRSSVVKYQPTLFCTTSVAPQVDGKTILYEIGNN